MANTNILQDISIYDKTVHLAFPKLEYVKQETGEDIVINQGNSTPKANAFIRQITKTAWNILKQTKLIRDQYTLEYLIATDPEYRLAFLDFVCSFIYDIYIVGADEFLKPQQNPDLSKVLSAKTQSFITASVLSNTNFYGVKYEIRVGY